MSDTITKDQLRRAWNYRQAIMKRIDAQTTKGIEKYGQTLEYNPAGAVERLNSLAEELTDTLAYIEWAKEWVVFGDLGRSCFNCNHSTVDYVNHEATNCFLPTEQFIKCACNPEHYKWESDEGDQSR